MSTPQSFSPATRSQAPAFHLTDYLRILHKRRWTAILAFLVVFVFGAFNSLKKTPIYQATAQLLIEKEARRATNINSVLEDQQGYEDEFYPTQIRILRSRALAWRAINAMGLNKPETAAARPEAKETPKGSGSLIDSTWAWVMDAIGAPKRIDPPPADETTAQSSQIGGFLGGLGVEQVRGTRLVNVLYMSPDPVFAERAANAVAQEYIKQTLDLRVQASKEALEYLQTALEEQRKKVEQSDAALQAYRVDQRAVALDERQSTITTKLSDINGQLLRAQLELADKQVEFLNLQSVQGDRDKLETFPAIMNDPTVQKLKDAVRTAQAKRAELNRYQPGMPVVVAADRDVKEATALLYQQEDKVVESVRNGYYQAQGKAQNLQKQLDDQNREALSLGQKGIAYAALQREAASNRTLYDSLLQKTKETGVSGEFKGSNIQIVDRAEVPRDPVLPNTSRDLWLACFTGIFVAVCLVIGFEYVDNRIRTPDEIKTYLGLSFLGIVPVVPLKKDGNGPLLTDDVPAAFSEAMRAVRTSLIFASADEGARSVVVTSTAPSEGKTLVSSNLAVALAQAEQRTLIVDCDMRRSRLHEVFGRPAEPGLSNVLVGTARLRDAIKPTTTANLFVLTAGHIPPNPAELLASNRFIELSAELEQQFDWIILDAPPVMAVTDAAVLAHRATGVLFVIGAEMTSRRNAHAAVEQLAAAKARFIGAVLNRVDLQRHGYYYSPYYRKDYTRVYERSTR